MTFLLASLSFAVLFVDAAVDSPREVRLRQLEPAETAQVMTHAADPRALLALARDVFGRAPEAWWLTIPAVKFDFSSELSPEAEQGIAGALDKIHAILLTSSNHGWHGLRGSEKIEKLGDEAGG